ncbi:putative membrane protein [Senna tora]|uniref:Putative membrane protein n=1 Tax=Senna tora TaxID=362788 RepID=A0A834U0X1_9FABA|nr:putative membrane protein [Senna tora]
MASSTRGKFFLLSFFLFLSSLHASSVIVKPESCSTQSDLHHNPSREAVSQPETSNHLNQEILLNKLEELMRNLSDIVTRLESKLPDLPKVAPSQDEEKEVEDVKIRDGDRARGVSVTKYSPFWSERFQFVSAVKLDSDATCINVLPFRDYEGLSKYVAVGDERGRVYVFLRNGDVLVEFYTSMESPITAMVSYTSARKNESFVVTGHGNGAILIHRIWEGASGEDWSSLYMENVGKLVSPQSEDDGLPITLLEVHYVGRMKYILSADTSGKIKVFRENGTFHGSAMPTSRPLAFLKQRLLFLTETGAGSLDLKGMRVRESECEGLNHSLARSYVFDATERSKAYGFTSDGDLVYVLLLGDVINFKCRVRYKKKFDMEDPLAFQAIKGYMLVVSPEKVFVYNVSSQHYVRVGVPRLIFSTSLDEIRSSFLNYPTMNSDVEKRVIPLIASDREKLVIMGLGGGYVAIYHSNLPLFKGEFNTMFWTSPVLFFILFLFGAWHFFAKKKEALTSWGPDDPFTSTSATTSAPSLGSGSGDRSFVDSSSRNAEMMDIRSGLRGPTRRYGSPSRYPAGAQSSYRLSSADHNPRPASVESDFRTASEIKFRGSTMEPPPGFPKRREGLFVSNQVVNDRS